MKKFLKLIYIISFALILFVGLINIQSPIQTLAATTTPTPAKVLTVEFNGNTFPQDLKSVIKDSLKNHKFFYLGKTYNFSSFIVYDYKRYQDSATANILIKDHPAITDTAILDDNPDSTRMSLVAKLNNDVWKITFSDEPNYNQNLDQLPNNLVDIISKARLKKYYDKTNARNAVASNSANAMISINSVQQQTVDYKFPWDSTQQWIMQDQNINGWHGGSCNAKCARDFSTPTTTGSWAVLASADGTVSRYCSQNQNTQIVYVIDNDGNEVGYWHLDRTKIQVSINQHVKQGDVLGYAYDFSGPGTYNDGCGSLSGTHLHMTLPYQSSPEITPNMIIDGWLFKYPNCPSLNGIAKCSGSVSSSNSTTIQDCRAPQNGDWDITRNCDYTGGQTVIGNITVERGVMLTIENGSSLSYNPLIGNVKVKSGGKILIKSGGSIYSVSD